MARKKQASVPKDLEGRLALIEQLHNQFKITDSMLDVLDTAARVEAGMLTFKEVLEEYIR